MNGVGTGGGAVLLVGSRPGWGLDPVPQVGLFISTSWDAADVFQFGFLPAFALSLAPHSNLNTLASRRQDLTS